MTVLVKRGKNQRLEKEERRILNLERYSTRIRQRKEERTKISRREERKILELTS